MLERIHTHTYKLRVILESGGGLGGGTKLLYIVYTPLILSCFLTFLALLLSLYVCLYRSDIHTNKQIAHLRGGWVGGVALQAHPRNKR